MQSGCPLLCIIRSVRRIDKHISGDTVRAAFFSCRKGQICPCLHLDSSEQAFTERRLGQLGIIAPSLAAPDSFMPCCDITSVQSEALALEHGRVRQAGRRPLTPCFCVSRRQSQIASVHFLLSDERQESCVLPRQLSDGPPHCDRPV